MEKTVTLERIHKLQKKYLSNNNFFFLKKSNRRPVVVKIVLLYWKYVSDIEKHCCRPRSRCENCENFENYNMRTTYVVYRFSVS